MIIDSLPHWSHKKEKEIYHMEAYYSGGKTLMKTLKE